MDFVILQFMFLYYRVYQWKIVNKIIVKLYVVYCYWFLVAKSFRHLHNIEYANSAALSDMFIFLVTLPEKFIIRFVYQKRFPPVKSGCFDW